MQIIATSLVASVLFAFPFAATQFAAPTLNEAESASVVTVHEVKMVQEGSAYRFEPANLTIKQGDQVKFVNVSGGPHNVAFDPAKVADAAEKALAAGMPNQIQPLSGALISKPGESYTVSFAGVQPGAYAYFCMPHVTMGMTGTITVQ